MDGIGNTTFKTHAFQGLVVFYLLAFGCSQKPPNPPGISSLKPEETHTNCRALYEEAVRTAEVAQQRIELDPKPWPSIFYRTLGWVDLRGDGRKSRFAATWSYGTRMGEDILNLTPPDDSEPLELRVTWNALDMYYPNGLEWSANADDPAYAPEREFLDTIKYAYGYVAESDILCRTSDPNYAVHFWGKENGHIAEGPLKIRRYNKKPRGFDPSGRIRLEDGSVIYARYRSGLMAHDRQKDEYFLVYRADSQYNSVSVLAKVDSWLLIGLWGEGLVAVDTRDYYLKRCDSIKETIGKIEVMDTKIIIDDGRYELDRPIHRTGEKTRPCYFGPTGLK